MWNLETPIFELILRAGSVFLFLFIVFRIWGKKHFGELSPFDFILLLIISESVQNALISDEKSVSGGFVTVGTLLILNSILNKLAYHFPVMEKIIDGTPKVLVSNGKIIDRRMRREKITRQVLDEAMREEGVLELDDIRQATLEADGSISIVKKERR